MNREQQKIQELINDPSFVDWAMGESEGSRADRWNRWVEQSEENRRIAIRAQKEITGLRFTSSDTVNVDREWNRVREDILRNEKYKRSAHPGSTSRGLAKNGVSLFLKAAAVLLVGAFVGYASFTFQKQEPVEQKVTDQVFETGYEQKKQINLSDGSEIILAAGSKMTVKSNWLQQPVKTIRLEGEALFNIAPNDVQGQPKFVVQTEDGTATVWGTLFTVDTYGTGTQVVLKEGEVRVKVDADNSGVETPEKKIYPGEMARFSRDDSQIHMQHVNPDVYTSWISNELYFDKTPLRVLVSRIERTYGVEVKVNEPEILDTRVSGAIDFRNLNGLMKAVSEVMGLTIEKSGQIVTIEQNQ